MDPSNISFTPPVCDDNVVIASNVLLSWPLSSPESSLASDSKAYLLGIGIPVALVVIFRLIRRYGPYIFTEAKSPSHRTSENDRLLSRIHNKWYDLTTFEHPGGPVALTLIHRRDGTALFESHHPFMKREKLMKILSKYEIPKEKQTSEFGCTLMDPRDDGYYTWDNIDNDKFVMDLKELVNDYFTPIAKKHGITLNQAAKATPGRWITILFFSAAFFGTLPWYVRGNWACMFITPALAWVMGANFWHDGLHFSLSTDWRVNAWLPYLFPFFSSPWMWYHEHVIGHHAYPNVDHKDPDLAHAPQLMREHRSIKWKPTHVGQSRWRHMLFVWSVAVGIGLQLLNDAKTNMKLSYNNVVPCASLSKPRIIAHILGRMGYFALMHMWPYFLFPLWKAMIWATLPGIVLSVCFMANTQINHLTDMCAHASDSTNFYKHQIVTAQNFGNGSLFCYYFSGGLNYQIEHHLFPNINHCHLPELAKGVKRICKKHGVPYNHAAGYRDAMKRHAAHTLEMEKKPVIE